MNLVTDIGWLSKNFSKAFNRLREFFQAHIKKSSVVIVRHYFERVSSFHHTCNVVINDTQGVLETPSLQTKLGEGSMQ